MVKPIIVFIHGNSLSKHIYEPLEKSILNKKFNLEFIELPGHGKKPPVEDYSIREMSSHIVKEILSYNRKLHVFAHSYSGHLIYQSLQKLQNVLSISTFGSPPLENILSMEKAFNQTNSANLFNQKITEEAMDKISKMMAKNSHKVLMEAIRNTDPSFRASFSLPGTFENFKNELECVNNSNVPINILFGREDPFININYASDVLIKIRNPSVKFRFIDFGLHVPFLDETTRFSAFYDELI